MCFVFQRKKNQPIYGMFKSPNIGLKNRSGYSGNLSKGTLIDSNYKYMAIEISIIGLL